MPACKNAGANADRAPFRKRRCTLFAVNKNPLAVFEVSGLGVDGPGEAFSHTAIAGFTKIGHPHVIVPLRHRQIFRIDEHCGESQAGTVFRGHEDAVFANAPQIGILSSRDGIDVSSYSRTRMAVVTSFSEIVCYPVDRNTQLDIGSKDLFNTFGAWPRSDGYLVHFRGQNHCVIVENLKSSEDEIGVHMGVAAPFSMLVQT